MIGLVSCSVLLNFSIDLFNFLQSVFKKKYGANTMQKLNIPSVDMDHASDGVWFPYTSTISFKVARDGHPRHKRALQGKLKQIGKMREKGEFSRIEHLNNEMTVQYILKDWKGLKEGTKNLPFEQATALSIISDPQYESLKNFIVDCSQDESAFETQEDEIVKK